MNYPRRPRRHSRATLIAMVVALLLPIPLCGWAGYSWYQEQIIDPDFVASVAVAEAEQLSDEEIARQLIALWLEHYRSVDVQRGITDYAIDEVEIRSSDGDKIVGHMHYSVKPFSLVFTDWDMTNGHRDLETGWIHKEFGFEVVRRGERLIFRLVSHHG